MRPKAIVKKRQGGEPTMVIQVNRRDIFKIAGVATLVGAIGFTAKNILNSPVGTPIKKLNSSLPKALKFLPTPPSGGKRKTKKNRKNRKTKKLKNNKTKHSKRKTKKNLYHH